VLLCVQGPIEGGWRCPARLPCRGRADRPYRTPVAAAESGTRHTAIGRERSQPASAAVPRGVDGSAAARLPHTGGRAAFSWRWSLPLVCAAEPQMGSLHWSSSVRATCATQKRPAPSAEHLPVSWHQLVLLRCVRMIKYGLVALCHSAERHHDRKDHTFGAK
jgi:hypothetical protein